MNTDTTSLSELFQVIAQDQQAWGLLSSALRDDLCGWQPASAETLNGGRRGPRDHAGDSRCGPHGFGTDHSGPSRMCCATAKAIAAHRAIKTQRRAKRTVLELADDPAPAGDAVRKEGIMQKRSEMIQLALSEAARTLRRSGCPCIT